MTCVEVFSAIRKILKGACSGAVEGRLTIPSIYRVAAPIPFLAPGGTLRNFASGKCPTVIPIIPQRGIWI